MKRKSMGAALMLAALNAVMPFHSSAATDSTGIIISGTVQAGSGCVINDNQPIIVEFGTMLIEDVMVEKHFQVIKLTMDCPGVEFADFRLQIRGEEYIPYPNSQYLKTSKDGLYINFNNNDYPLYVNRTWYDFIYPSTLTIYAHPGIYKTIPTTGHFYATATFVIEAR